MSTLKPQSRGFYELQPYHVQEILLVSSLYDAFIFEEDGQLNERIFSEYSDLHLHYAPRITQASSAEKALEMLKVKNYDLVITTLQLEDSDVINFCKQIKQQYPHISTVLLTYAPSRLPALNTKGLEGTFDGVFTWNGDTRIFLAIIKQIEDRLNTKHDTEIANVRVILVVEDSVKNYSSFLPLLYYEVMDQTRSLMSLSLNKEKKIFRMRTRPKILLATNYEDAIKICEEYKNYLIGLISDVRFSKNGKIEPEAGFSLIHEARGLIPDLPVILHSNEPENSIKAREIGVSFIDKNSPILLQELGRFLKKELGFGDFVFKMPDGKIVGRASDMKGLEEKLKTVPDESIKYHAQKNHFSIWLMARGEFILANKLRPRKVEDFKAVEDLRKDLIDSLRKTRYESQRGVIADFSFEKANAEYNFRRIGSGSLGGKARGLAFINALLAQKQSRALMEKYNSIEIYVPRTVVIGTDEFDKFIKHNKLAIAAIQEEDDEKISELFLKSKIREDLSKKLDHYLKQVTTPLAVRSSSLLEDSHAQPFAGIYSTYMLPNNDPDPAVRLKQLLDAVKLTYASTFYQAAKSYLAATNNRIEEEKMGIVIQQIAGRQYTDLFYPSFSGVVRNINFFPVADMKHEDGVAYVALGLGKAVMDGQNVLQFSPKHPNILPQLVAADFSIQNTQREFYALDLSNSATELTWNESSTLRKEDLARAEKDGTLEPIGSTYDINNDVIRDGIHHKGLRFVSFAHVLKSGLFPLSELLNDILDLGKSGLGSSVEIEFAVNLAQKPTEKHKFYFLQIRPMIAGQEQTNVEIGDVERDNILCSSHHSMGNGIIKNIKDIIYVRPHNFEAANSQKIAEEIGKINHDLKGQALFIGLGRWGSSDPWLGIPVKWNQISNAKVLIEAALEKFNIDPSHGSHFFHNMTSLGIGYMSIPATKDDGFIDWDWLENQKALYESPLVRHVVLDKPIEVILNGRKGIGTIIKPTE